MAAGPPSGRQAAAEVMINANKFVIIGIEAFGMHTQAGREHFGTTISYSQVWL